MPSTKSIGDFYEKKALKFYKNLGANIVSKNYRYQKGEIDLIVELDDLLIFVEVKFRAKTTFGYPEEWVSSSQQNRILETAAFYIEEFNWKREIRFDVIAFTLNEMRHFEDAF
jgi:putative endonuclease